MIFNHFERLNENLRKSTKGSFWGHLGVILRGEVTAGKGTNNGGGAKVSISACDTAVPTNPHFQGTFPGQHPRIIVPVRPVVMATPWGGNPDWTEGVLIYLGIYFLKI